MILVCVTVTVATQGTGAPMVIQMIHAIALQAAETAITRSLTGTVIGAASAAIAEYQQSGDASAVLNAAAEGASQGFMWGAIEGAIEGGIEGAIGFKTKEIRNPYQSEDWVAKLYNGESQQSFLNGEAVTYGTDGSTRPDVLVSKADGTFEAIEVKNYNLKSTLSLRELFNTLVREISARVTHMPEGTTQRIVLDVAGRGYSQSYVNKIISDIHEVLSVIYPDIPIDAIW